MRNIKNPKLRKLIRKQRFTITPEHYRDTELTVRITNVVKKYSYSSEDLDPTTSQKYDDIDINIVVGGTIYGRDLTDYYNWSLRYDPRGIRRNLRNMLGDYPKPNELHQFLKVIGVNTGWLKFKNIKIVSRDELK